jgi:hypothetical protein
MIRRKQFRRSGKVLVLILIALPSIFAIVGLVLDSGFMMSGSQDLHHATDAGAMAAAMDLLLGKSSASATSTATTYIAGLNGFTDAQTTVNIPPQTGPYAGQSNFAEVISNRSYQTRFMQIVGANSLQTLSTRSVAGVQTSTAGAAVVVLDPNPSQISVSGVPAILPAYPAIVGGLEVLGLGSMNVNGAVLVNTTWGGVDENGNPAGTSSGPPYGISCTPLISLTHLNALNIRVSGGVDNPNNYGNYTSGQGSPLLANQLAVPDPFQSLAVPTTSSDPANVSTTNYGGVRVVNLPLISAPTILNPGVYDWIEVDSGQAVFSPGIYIIRNVNPLTNIALNIVGGTVTANGVMFYITNSSTYDPTSGAPDSADGSSRPSQAIPTTLIPSVAIDAALPGSSYKGLSDASSPYNGMLIYQRRDDLRPMIIAEAGLLGPGMFSGTLYAKWGAVEFAADGTYDLRVVAGTAAFVSELGLTLMPSTLLPAAQDVFLVE